MLDEQGEQYNCLGKNYYKRNNGPGGGGVDMKMKVDTQEEYKKKGKKGDFNTQGNNNIYHQIFLHFIT